MTDEENSTKENLEWVFSGWLFWVVFLWSYLSVRDCSFNPDFSKMRLSMSNMKRCEEAKSLYFMPYFVLFFFRSVSISFMSEQYLTLSDVVVFVDNVSLHSRFWLSTIGERQRRFILIVVDLKWHNSCSSTSGGQGASRSCCMVGNCHQLYVSKHRQASF